ncbi:MAG: hypothetical protein A3B16_02330 [Candidatus Zambryskibacteria bacterium RIFCSPLOWO2_01_FULL_45_43]|uniref:Uncharacterized protein n=1 Tax=Candidatus Zambryskibacteria bacterium RIFCSPLOWO2_01_FULL_45_43 TaxID=1802762 RepID=A0A1G2UAA9_9BACT|nr:MAG: hypothetical protein A3B16_02330 [Candidatus Zambryskibacteria bacterium RIFCSPLOWO2_01_FULL_45_43]
MLSQEQIDSFKKLYKKEFGKDLTDEEALEQATKLTRLVRLVYKPITKKEYAEYHKRRKRGLAGPKK